MSGIVTNAHIFIVQSLDLKNATVEEIEQLLEETDWILDTDIAVKLGTKQLIGSLRNINENHSHSSSDTIITRNDTIMKIENDFVRSMDTVLFNERYNTE
jgi:HEAT repeat protein